MKRNVSLPAITELSKLHLFVLTYPLRVLIIPTLVVLAMIGNVTLRSYQMDEPDSVGEFVSQLPWRLVVVVPLMSAVGLIGTVDTLWHR